MIRIRVTSEILQAFDDAYHVNLDPEYALRRAFEIVERDLNTGKSDGVLNCSEHDMGDCPYHRGPSQEIWNSGSVEVWEK